MTETKTYTIPLRKDFVSKPKYKRAKRAIKKIKMFTSKHMKTNIEDVRVSSGLNEVVWQNGARNPPGKVTVLMQQKGSLVHVVHKDEKDFLASLEKTEEETDEEQEETTKEQNKEEEEESATEEESSEDEETEQEESSQENKGEKE